MKQGVQHKSSDYNLSSLLSLWYCMNKNDFTSLLYLLYPLILDQNDDTSTSFCELVPG